MTATIDPVSPPPDLTMLQLEIQLAEAHAKDLASQFNRLRAEVIRRVPQQELRSWPKELHLTR